MTRNTRLVAFVIVIAGSIAVSTSPAVAQTPNVVIQWNQILQTLFSPAPGVQLRSLPMLHIAMFDAINSIENIYTPYRVQIKGTQGASAEAAAAQAARDVLTALFPDQQASFDATLASQLGAIPPVLIYQGSAVGRAA